MPVVTTFSLIVTPSKFQSGSVSGTWDTGKEDEHAGVAIYDSVSFDSLKGDAAGGLDEGGRTTFSIWIDKKFAWEMFFPV